MKLIFKIQKQNLSKNLSNFSFYNLFVTSNLLVVSDRKMNRNSTFSFWIFFLGQFLGKIIFHFALSVFYLAHSVLHLRVVWLKKIERLKYSFCEFLAVLNNLCVIPGTTSL